MGPSYCYWLLRPIKSLYRADGSHGRESSCNARCVEGGRRWRYFLGVGRFLLLFTILPLVALALVLWLVVDADEALHPL